MTYRQGSPILASDYNSFRTELLDVYDVGDGNTGYGQISVGGAAAIPTVAIGEVVKSVEWKAFRDAADICSSHQGSTTTFPPDPELDVAELVEAHAPADGNAFDTDGSLSTIRTNRLTADAGSVTVFSNALNSTRGTAWSVQLQHLFTATFPTVDEARYFFNSGGEIRLRASRTGGSVSDQNTNWSSILTNMGTIIFNHSNTSGGGAGWTLTGAGTGYYDLSTIFQPLATGIFSAASAYTGVNTATIECRSVDGEIGPFNDKGRQLQFRVLYTDGHANAFFDSVDGTITSDVDYRKATSPLTITAPVFATSVGLTAGS
jgi:hypothetical protein